MKQYLNKLFARESLSEQEANEAMNLLMGGRVSPEEVGAFLGALRGKGETIEEITGCAKSLRDHAIPLRIKRTDLIDTCGTGGDGANTFNISTTNAFVIAAAGLGVCKHGNRSISSKCGSADVLEELGVPIDLEPERVAESIDRYGFGFLFAPKFHPAMGHVVPIRRNLGARTIFNLLGPLVNPAFTKRQVMGVYDRKMLEPFAYVLASLGAEEVMLVTGDDGLDEITTTTTTQVAHLKDGQVKTYTIDPRDYGIDLARAEDLAGGDRKTNADIITRILRGDDHGPKRDIVAINGAAALLVGGKVSDLGEGLKAVHDILDQGKAWEVLQAVRGGGA
ncbi:anthranilate phosphoribosyltransferase [Pseudobacteriovorax antillogorgiicola]|uniref:Anthranilate phosphoribosyltransferase n=1 Tax=Pseudobacteriovorax antillogorgiicola TaxID=1513793 RepID=A0A1Y6B5P6_9BACT|nr:anthranilate phosphoribosyltransferase [Pseudobacteriovorax antillogorgiicola]TCS58882.1 anthranilate phosphoribosyltransferase [Pseudobacteriovorax antillogorgiicola]SME93674.1 anthranilate phosphoribosyltransferase [Pseudobacteriovorax antillogorgiicola]